MNGFKKIIWNTLNAIGLGGAVQLHLKSAPRQYGWYRSFHTKRSVDARGEPLPWYTYPFIAFLGPRLTGAMQVFEYGSGNSTRWYAARVGHITAVEHDEAWVAIVSPQLPANATLLARTLGGDYVGAVTDGGTPYQIVIVDGRMRVECVLAAIDSLASDGVLILDNSEREIYRKAREFMAEKGFRCLDFYGMTLIVSDESCTSVFYRSENCLKI